MKTKDITAIARKLLPSFPEFVVKGKLMFIPPVGDFLRGIYFEGSSDSKSFYLRVLYLPLFLPQEDVNFIHGERIGNALDWTTDNPNLLDDLRKTICEKASPFLDSVSTLAGVLECVKWDVKSDWPRVNSHHLEELACVLIKSGDYSAALESLADLKQRLEKSTTQWVVKQRNRAQLIEEKLLQSPEAALQQLEIWKAETVRNLGLEKFLSA